MNSAASQPFMRSQPAAKHKGIADDRDHDSQQRAAHFSMRDSSLLLGLARLIQRVAPGQQHPSSQVLMPAERMPSVATPSSVPGPYRWHAPAPQHHFGPAREQRGGYEGADEKTHRLRSFHGDSRAKIHSPIMQHAYIMNERFQ